MLINKEIQALNQQITVLKECFLNFGKSEIIDISIQEKLSDFMNKDFLAEVEMLIIGHLSVENPVKLRKMYEGVISSLKHVIIFYEKNKLYFDNYNRGNIYNFIVRKNFDEKISILENDILDIPDYNQDKETIIQDFKKDILKLKTQQYEFERSSLNVYLTNYHKEVYFAFKNIIKLINTYFSNNTTSIHPLELIGKAHTKFNGTLWESVTIRHFEEFMNFPNEISPITPCGDRKTNLYILMNYFSKEIADKNIKKNWIASINKILNAQITKKTRLEESVENDVFMEDLCEIFGISMKNKIKRKNK